MTADTILAPTPGGAPAAGPVKGRRWGWPVILLLVAAGLAGVRRGPGDHRGRRPHVLGRGAGGARRGGAHRPGRPRRSVVGARRRDQHWPRGHDDPRHLGRRLGRADLRRVGRHHRRRRLRRPRRPAARPRHRDVQRRPHRVRRGDHDPRVRSGAVPLLAHLRQHGGRRRHPVAERAVAAGSVAARRQCARRGRRQAVVPSQRPRRHRCAAC